MLRVIAGMTKTGVERAARRVVRIPLRADSNNDAAIVFLRVVFEDELENASHAEMSRCGSSREGGL